MFKIKIFTDSNLIRLQIFYGNFVRKYNARNIVITCLDFMDNFLAQNFQQLNKIPFVNR